MKAGKYTVKEFFVNRYLQQVIVPEIQRDYVWPEKPLLGLLDSLQEAFRGFTQFPSNFTPLQLKDQTLETSFRDYQQRLTHSASIGFVYAYSDDEYPGRYFLIDGQQRLTSLLLMLLALAHRHAGLREPFRRIFYTEDEVLKLDYKVREASHDFLAKLVGHVLSGNTGNVEDQTWHYTAATTDVTVQTLLHNFNLLVKQFAEWQCDGFASQAEAEEKFFTYLTDFTEFYYFDTNLSEQGEDLYIYMNARGEQMQANENLKADLLGALKEETDKEAWGREWERWQDFFWQHRGAHNSENPNPNADNGFNGFLGCIAGLTNLVNGKNPNQKQPAGAKSGSVLDVLDLQTIGGYVACLEYLQNNRERFAEGYTYSAWVTACLKDFWTIINNGEKTNWNTDYNDANRGTERSQMAFVWPVLRFLYRQPNLAILPPEDAFRVLRMHYLRYHSYDRAVAGLEAEADERLRLDLFDTGRTDEEKAKHALYKTLASDQVRRYEELIWQIEDHPFNLDSSDVGGTNLTYLVTLSPAPTLDGLERIKEKFYELLPERGSHHALQSALLHYGPYQHEVNPTYYYNYDFGDWKRTVRGKGSVEQALKNPESFFKTFLNSFLEKGLPLHEFIRQHIPVIRQEDAHEHHKMILWYSQQLQGDVWLYNQGRHIAVASHWPEKDAHFDCPVIFSTGGSFMGYKNKPLYELLSSRAAPVVEADANA